MDALSRWIAEKGTEAIVIILSSVLLYFIGSFLIQRLLIGGLKARAKQQDWHKKDLEKRLNTLTTLVNNCWRVVVIAVAAFSLFRLIFPNADMAPLFASAGVVGIAVAFGSQSLAKDFLSGLFIISENQYRVGDVIEIEGFGGTVERIGARSTVLRDVDGNVHYFPNGMIQHVINKTMGFSMARFTVSIDPDQDIEAVIRMINQVGTTLAEDAAWKHKIIEPPKFTMLGEFSANTASLTIAGKTQPSDQWSVTSAMRRRLLEEFERNNIKLGVAPQTMPKKK